MKMPTSPLSTAALVLLLAQSASAASIVSLALAADQTTVAIGQPITVRVELTGLTAGDQLDSLAATVSYDNTLLGIPTVTAGPIVPNPRDDPLDLLISTGPGVADVAFLTFGTAAADHITTSGIFFTFSATALAPGTVDIAVDFAGATLFNSANPGDPTVLLIEPGQPFSLTIVPEPHTISLALMFAIALQRCHRKRAKTLARSG